MRSEGYQLITVYQQVEAAEAAMAVLSRWDGEFGSTLAGLKKKRNNLEKKALEIQEGLRASSKGAVNE